MAHGWLPCNDALSWTIHGVAVAPETRTRREEYHWVASVLNALGSGLHVLDAATGYVPGWHMMPYIAAACGHRVTAVDSNPTTVQMPAHPSVERAVMNISKLDYPDDSFDAVLCISTLEHMDIADAATIVKELLRVTRGPIILTADKADWLPSLLAGKADIGEPMPWAGPHLEPPVYVLDGCKLAM